MPNSSSPRRRAVLAALPVLLLLLASTAPAAQVQVVDDSFFDPLDWVYDKAPNPNECLELRDPGGTLCDPDGSEPSSDGDSRVFVGNSELSNENHVQTLLIVGAHVAPALAYSPSSSGEVLNVDGGFQYWAARATQGVSSTTKAHLLIEQAGNFYISNVFISITTLDSDQGFFPFGFSDLEADDFSRVSLGGIDPGSNPDFSTSGADLHFGFAVDLEWNGPFPPNPFVADFLVRAFRIDEFSVSVTTQDPPASVPVLGTLGLLALGLGLGGVGISRLRR